MNKKLTKPRVVTVLTLAVAASLGTFFLSSTASANQFAATGSVTSSSTVPIEALSSVTVPSGFSLKYQNTQDVPDPAGGTVHISTKRYVNAGVPLTEVGIQVDTTSTGDWAARLANEVSLSHAKTVATVNGKQSYYSTTGSPDNGFSKLTWVVSPATKVSVWVNGPEWTATALQSIAQSIGLAPTGATMAKEGSAALSPQLILSPALTASCSGSCPTSTDMRGDGVPWDDWNINPLLCDTSSCIHNGNMVGVWQAVMWADDTSITGGGNTTTSCDVDGQFGPNTANWTEWWQIDHSLSADGYVGPNTWSHASVFLNYDGSLIIYQGFGDNLYFTRGSASPGYYSWSWNNSPYYYTGYTGIQIVKSLPATGCSIAHR